MARLIQNFQIFFFLPTITDRNEDIDKYLKNLSISPINITEEQFNKWAGVDFNPAKLDMFGADKTIRSAAVIECLRHINSVSNSNVLKNTDALLSKREVKVHVD